MIGYVISLMLYGCYACVFTTTLWVYKPLVASRFDFVRCAVMLVFALCTAQEVIAIVHNWKSWIGHQDPAAFDPTVGAKDLLLYIQGLIGEALFMWRLYIVWSRSVRVIILPLVALATYIAVTVAISFRVFRSDLWPQDDGNTSKLMYVDTSLGLFMNVYTTSLVIGQLWWTGRQVQRFSDGTEKNWYLKIIRAILESGSPCTATILALVITPACSPPGAVVILTYMGPMLIGITPTLLVLQLHITRLKRNQSGGRQTVFTTIRFAAVAEPTRAVLGDSQSSQQDSLELPKDRY